MPICVISNKYICSFTDYDECELNDTLCHKDATCTNTRGSYRCDCNTGYTGDGETYCNSILTKHM